jgi:hypothetical protein
LIDRQPRSQFKLFLILAIQPDINTSAQHYFHR